MTVHRRKARPENRTWKRWADQRVSHTPSAPIPSRSRIRLAGPAAPRIEAKRLTSLGATVVAHHEESGESWTVMRDPFGKQVLRELIPYSAGFSQTETCARLSAVNGAPVHPLHRSRSRKAASLAIGSSSEGQT